MLHTSNKILLSHGSKTIENILRNNNIIAHQNEKIKSEKYFFIKPIQLLLQNTLITTSVIKFLGEMRCIHLTFTDNSSIILQQDSEILVSFENKNDWISVKRLNNKHKILSVLCNQVKVLKIKKLCFLGNRPVWKFNCDSDYVVLGNGIIIKNEQYFELCD